MSITYVLQKRHDNIMYNVIFSHFSHEKAVCTHNKRLHVHIDLMSADGPLINLIILTLLGVARYRLISIQIQSIFHGLFVIYAYTPPLFDDIMNSLLNNNK